jgi:hypothetical protein
MLKKSVKERRHVEVIQGHLKNASGESQTKSQSQGVFILLFWDFLSRRHAAMPGYKIIFTSLERSSALIL